MAFTAKDVANLRERTGCGMMDCKKALTDADGDFDKAIDILREKGLAASAKKAGRIASEGMVYAYVENNTGVVVEVNAETDFVAKNADFVAFVETIAKTIAENSPADVEALAGMKASGSDMTVAELLTEKILVIGENMKIRRFEKYDGAVVSYVHAGGKIAVFYIRLCDYIFSRKVSVHDQACEINRNIRVRQIQIFGIKRRIFEHV